MSVTPGEVGQRFTRPSSFVLVTCVAAVLAGCTSTSTATSTPSLPSSSAASHSTQVTASTQATVASSSAGACQRVGVLLPDTTDPRWQGLDGPQLAQQIPASAPGTQVTVDNAGGAPATQLSQATTDLNNGDCVLVVAAVDPSTGAQIASDAVAHHAQVIAYARPISDATATFVGFDPTKIGALQGTYVVDHYAQFAGGGRPNVVLIEGAGDDPLAVRQVAGQLTALQPLFDAGALKKVYQQFTPKADPATARAEMEGALTANQNNVQVAVVATDTMAAEVIAALAAQKLNGRVLVTGSGSDLPALHRVVAGTQAMSVETNPIALAKATAVLVAALLRGQSTTAMVNGQIASASGVTSPAVLLDPALVDQATIATTVIADGLVSKAQLCAGLPPTGPCA